MQLQRTRPVGIHIGDFVVHAVSKASDRAAGDGRSRERPFGDGIVDRQHDLCGTDAIDGICAVVGAGVGDLQRLVGGEAIEQPVAVIEARDRVAFVIPRELEVRRHRVGGVANEIAIGEAVAGRLAVVVDELNVVLARVIRKLGESAFRVAGDIRLQAAEGLRCHRVIGNSQAIRECVTGARDRIGAGRREADELARIAGCGGELDGRPVDDQHVIGRAFSQTAHGSRTITLDVDDLVAGHEVVRRGERDRVGVLIDLGAAVEDRAEGKIVLARRDDAVLTVIAHAGRRRPVVHYRVTGAQPVVEHMQGVRVDIGGQHLIVRRHGAGARRGLRRDRDVVTGAHRGRQDVGGDLGLDYGV